MIRNWSNSRNNTYDDARVENPAENDEQFGIAVAVDNGLNKKYDAHQEENQNNERTNVLPAQKPVLVRIHLKHFVDVTGESIRAVDPANADGLEEHDEHESGRRGERVQKCDHIGTAVGDRGQRAQEEEKVNESQKRFAIVAHNGELVGQSRVDGFEAAEAAVQAEIYDH